MNNLLKHHGAGSPKARGPMQPHRLHRLKAGPGFDGRMKWLRGPHLARGP